MTRDEIATFIEERGALEDARASEPDYVGPRGLGKYLRALATEIRDEPTVIAGTDITNREHAPHECDYWEGYADASNDKNLVDDNLRLKSERDALAIALTHSQARAEDAERNAENRTGDMNAEIGRLSAIAREWEVKCDNRVAALEQRDRRIAELEAALHTVSDKGCFGGPCKDIARAALSVSPAQPATAAKASPYGCEHCGHLTSEHDGGKCASLGGVHGQPHCPCPREAAQPSTSAREQWSAPVDEPRPKNLEEQFRDHQRAGGTMSAAPPSPAAREATKSGLDFIKRGVADAVKRDDADGWRARYILAVAAMEAWKTWGTMPTAQHTSEEFRVAMERAIQLEDEARRAVPPSAVISSNHDEEKRR